MSLLTQPPDFSIPRLPVRRFSVAEYHNMIAAGILTEDDRVELLHGWIVPKMSRNPPHDAVLDITHELIQKCLPDGWRLRIQSAITTVDASLNRNLAVVRGQAKHYVHCHPKSADIGMLVEVAETSLDKDRTEKGPIYAAANIAHYWIVNIVKQTVEVYGEPSATGYNQRTDYSKDQEAPLILDGR